MTVLFWKLNRDRRGNFRATATSRNGKRLWASTEGYERKAACIRNAALFGGPKCLGKVSLGSLVRVTV